VSLIRVGAEKAVARLIREFLEFDQRLYFCGEGGIWNLAIIRD
jgi:hypothetical protein